MTQVQDRPIVFNAEQVNDFRELVIHLTMFDMGARLAGRVSIDLELWRDLVMAPALRLMAHMEPPASELAAPAIAEGEPVIIDGR